MSSPGVMHARVCALRIVKYAPKHEEAQPIDFEQTRQRLLDHLLSKARPLTTECKQIAFLGVHHGLARDLRGEHAAKPRPINNSAGKPRKPEEFCYFSSFDRLTSKKPKANTAASLPMRVHLLNVLAVTAALLTSAAIYVWAWGGFAGLTAEVRARSQVPVKIRPERDLDNLPKRPAPVAAASFKDTDSKPSQSIDPTSSDRLLYSTKSIVFTPLR